MAGQILTEVSGVVDPGRVAELVDGFREIAAAALPDGLLRSELLQGDHGQWRIQTLWRDQAALDAMRAGAEPPAAPALLRSVGAEPVLRILEVVGSFVTAH
ncbi:quinol monooxygenase YgiN [Kribbella aluminosa]|uniref:Quinol monooxygenase YgiN n=1 Tax=Kribbella aluminosa TaxID=416017 RepID=A0ABS4UJK8_9ACTN|nr:antibiotic biosynthesis monooxygenase [Kribbella aluminosa]MBP2351845.1 quinol monooxygenase YgiN [Kribbella aluminosa]